MAFYKHPIQVTFINQQTYELKLYSCLHDCSTLKRNLTNTEILFSKTAFLSFFLCLHFLASTVDDGRINLRNSRPMLFSASGRRLDRIWGEKRTHLGGDTNASGRRYERVWGEIRSHLGRRSLTNIEIDLLGALHRVSFGVAMSLTRCGRFIPMFRVSPETRLQATSLCTQFC